ncbi:MAG: NAD(P)H-hydrate dehydratase [Candidatus Bathyarchaeota archaeon]|nr:MAG: NAD(P)H-hydrate dehydratase [Candidatus Bathyarchaeota archaeon]
MILDETLTAREMRAVEMNSEYLGVSRLMLMENAGHAVAEAVVERFESKNRVAVVCGLGGNGGDGFVAARHLAAAGYPVEVLLLGRPEIIRSDEAIVNWKALKRMRHSLSVREIRDSEEITPLNGDVVIDALIGTGVSGPLSSPYREMVKAINEASGFKIAVDIPTGVDSNTGEAHGEAVAPDLTLTFHKPKTGLIKASERLGQLVTRSIGIPLEAERCAGPGDVFLATRERSPEAHKGDFGTLLVVGGSETYSGAPALTAMAAYAVGVDLVYVAAPETVSSVIAGFSPNLITVKLKGSRLNQKNVEKLDPLYGKVDAVAIGPGLGLHDETVEAVNRVLDEVEDHKLAVLIDADALKSFPKRRDKITTEAVFTPHYKEFEILTGKTPKGSLEERGERVRKEASRLGTTILLKGSVDIMSDGERTRFNWTGNPGMTVGGTGDVLSGVTAGFIAMGIKAFQAAVAGAFVNGAAGDSVFREKGHQLEASDLIEKIPFAIEESRAGRMEHWDVRKTHTL